MRTGAARASRTLKNLFQEAGLPEWRRDVPVILLGDDVLYVPGLGLNHDPAVTDPQVIAQKSDAQHDDIQSMQWIRLEWRADLLIA
jgi:tRNA(Ile)-lysidine synthase